MIQDLENKCNCPFFCCDNCPLPCEEGDETDCEKCLRGYAPEAVNVIRLESDPLEYFFGEYGLTPEEVISNAERARAKTVGMHGTYPISVYRLEYEVDGAKIVIVRIQTQYKQYVDDRRISLEFTGKSSKFDIGQLKRAKRVAYECIWGTYKKNQ